MNSRAIPRPVCYFRRIRMLFRFYATLSLVLSAGLSAHAALITSHTDTTIGSASVDGIISANEYGPGNAYSYTGGGSGFGGQLGGSTIYLKSDALYLYVGFSSLGVAGDANHYLVYIHTRTGGFQTDGTEMDDGIASNPSDAGRRNTSELSQDGTEYVTFFAGATNRPDFTLLFNNRGSPDGFSALFELNGAGNAHDLITHNSSGIGTGQVEFRVALADLAITNGGTIDFTAIDISETGYLSNEGLPNPNLSSNYGFHAGGTLTYSNFHRFNTLFIENQQGLSQRVANVTLNFPQTIPPPTTNSYITENAFPGLSLISPMAATTAPGETNRLYILERAGRIVVVTNLMSPTRTVFLLHTNHVNASGEGGFLGLAFHPDYQSNRQFFVCYTKIATNGSGTGFHNRLSRFERTTTNVNLALSSTEVVLYSQFDNQDNHNAGDIHFGPDDYLYVATGDEGGGNDGWNNSQKIDQDFFSALLRIDVDKKPGSLAPKHHLALGGVTNYGIPPNNPFISTTNYYGSNVVPSRVRTEFYATGLRNPFRFSFDEVTGLLYLADVGQNAWEEVNLITNGGNYGWAAWEGFAPGPKPNARPATDYSKPILAYSAGTATNQGESITGGIVYRGDRFPELVGSYIFADHVRGHIWSLTHNGITNTTFRWLYTDDGNAGFESDPSNGDILICHPFENQVKRLVYSSSPTGSLPATLSLAGIFSNLENLTPYAGIVPYDVNLPFWSDGAIKRRWFSIPSTNLFITFRPEQSWLSPTTTVWIKHFDILLTNGSPTSVRRLETRVLVKNNSPEGGYGVTYRWGNSISNAALVQAQGLNEDILINESGVIRTQVWRYPSRSECLSCHNPNAGFALSFNTPQMNCNFSFDSHVTNQIAAYRNTGYFSNTVDSINLLRKLAHPSDTEYSTTYRVRSYFQANCGQCHIPGGPTSAAFDTYIFTTLGAANIIDGALNDNSGNPSNRVIVRNSLTNSMILNRISKRGPGQMPPLGSNLLDTQNIALVTAWITGEAAEYETYAEWQVRHFGSTNSPDAQPDFDFDGDGNHNELEYLTGTQPTNHLDVWGITAVDTEGEFPSLIFDQVAGAGFNVQVSTNLIDGDWLSLDIPENAPFFTASTVTTNIPDREGTNLTERYYRVNVYEP